MYLVALKTTPSTSGQSSLVAWPGRAHQYNFMQLTSMCSLCQGFAPGELVSRGQPIFRGGGIRLVYNLGRISFQAGMSAITLASVYIGFAEVL